LLEPKTLPIPGLVENVKTQKEDCVETNESVTPATNEGLENDSTESGESEQQGEANTEKAPAKEAKAAQIRRLAEGDLDAVVTVKVNGEVKELSVREVMKLNQLEKASQSKMQEASKLNQQAQEVFKLAKTNPREFLRRTGIDPDEFAESTLAEKFELMRMSPEQKRLKELEEKEKNWEKREKDEKEYKEKEHHSRLEAQEMETLDKEIGEALRENKISSKYMAAQVAARLLSASRQNKTLTAKEAAASVKQESVSSFVEVLKSMDAPAILELLGKDLLKMISSEQIKRVSGNQTSHSLQSPGSKPASPQKAFKNEAEWRKEMDSIRANLRD
jgi:hypothetical protein